MPCNSLLFRTLVPLALTLPISSNQNRVWERALSLAVETMFLALNRRLAVRPRPRLSGQWRKSLATLQQRWPGTAAAVIVNMDYFWACFCIISGLL